MVCTHCTTSLPLTVQAFVQTVQTVQLHTLHNYNRRSRRSRKLRALRKMRKGKRSTSTTQRLQSDRQWLQNATPSFTAKTTVTPVVQTAHLHFCTLNKLEGSRGKPLELVKTLFVVFPIVNFPAEGSQTPMIPHFSNAPKFL